MARVPVRRSMICSMPHARARINQSSVAAVLAMPGVKWLMILEGINDIGQALRNGAPPENAITADDVIGAYKQMIERGLIRPWRCPGATRASKPATR